MKQQIKTKCAIFPMPVLLIATYNDDETIDVMNAAWGMMIDESHIALNLSASHKTVKNILKRKAFTVSLATKEYVKEADYFGVVSNNNVLDKFLKSKLTATKSNNVDAPIINEFKVTMECEFIDYDESKFGAGVIAKVVNVIAEDDVITNNNVDISKLNAIAYDPFTNGYYVINERVGNAFKDGLKIK